MADLAAQRVAPGRAVAGRAPVVDPDDGEPCVDPGRDLGEKSSASCRLGPPCSRKTAGKGAEPVSGLETSAWMRPPGPLTSRSSTGTLVGAAGPTAFITTWPVLERITGGLEALDQAYSTWPPGLGRASSMTP
ncbi:hypothetical protein [Nonomuraea recticatena]|uniref:hypothetical protein n=1 Tax=Nonomuraea recticatena TaxID=46178 RepID=UPI003614CFF2